MKSFKEYVSEAKTVTINIDWAPDSRKETGLINNARDSLGVKIKPKADGTADVTGKPNDIIMILKSKAYMGYNDDEIKDIFPELFK